jgi:hypothetical protein
MISIVCVAIALLAANCGDESEVIIEELDCQLEGFPGGNFTFSVTGVSDSPENCTFGLSDEIVGEIFGPVAIPATEDLPSDPTVIGSFPIVGSVEVIFSTDGEAIQVTGTDQIEGTYPGIGSFTATLSGVICPVSTARAEGQLTVSITQPFQPVTCNVTARATGQSQQ